MSQPVLHRDGNVANEHLLGNPPIPLVGGPLDGQSIHQPLEVAEVEMKVSGGLAKYRREGDAISQPKYVYVA